MARKNVKLSIVFADISGSTRLYESLGDQVARQLIAECIELMTEQVTKYSGYSDQWVGLGG